MSDFVPVVNNSADLGSCRDKWTFHETYRCWCLEDVLYTQKACVPKFQRLSIFVPEALRSADGAWTEHAKEVPVVFENNAAGYMQMPHVWLDGPRCYAAQYLEKGWVYVSCGCRGRESRDKAGRLVGKSPASLIDLKTALRFLRHNKAVLPGDWAQVVSVGWSAGGAMSALLGVTGDNESYAPLLRENGAYLEESDAVFAAQIYCPILDLEHADQAYEWMFAVDKTCEDSPAGPAETMTPFKEALSKQLAEQYVCYFNSLGLKDPETGVLLQFDATGRGGTAYAYFMRCLNASATDFLQRLSENKLPERYTPSDYLCGNYARLMPAPMPPRAENLHNADMRHAGQALALKAPPVPMGLGDLLSRPPKGVETPIFAPPMRSVQGADKRAWLTWDGRHASVSSLDAYVKNHRGRMKPCTSFDKLTLDSGENQVFGAPEQDFMHFNTQIAQALAALKSSFPEECARYAPLFAKPAEDAALLRRVYLLNPFNFIGAAEKSTQAKHFRIRVGAGDADTSLTVGMTLALKLQNAGVGTVDYALVWDKPHSEADYPGEVTDWISSLRSELRTDR